MGTHPIFESDFDCLTDMKLLPLFITAATTVLASKFDETESDYTIIVAPGKRDCYYENFKSETSFELEYQVTDGGDLDITLEIFDPSGKRVISDVRQEDGLHNLESNKGGDFQFCFDNRFSRMASKTVFWEVFLDDADYDDYDYADYKLCCEPSRPRIAASWSTTTSASTSGPLSISLQWLAPPFSRFTCCAQCSTQQLRPSQRCPRKKELSPTPPPTTTPRSTKPLPFSPFEPHIRKSD